MLKASSIVTQRGINVVSGIVIDAWRTRGCAWHRTASSRSTSSIKTRRVSLLAAPSMNYKWRRGRNVAQRAANRAVAATRASGIAHNALAQPAVRNALARVVTRITRALHARRFALCDGGAAASRGSPYALAPATCTIQHARNMAAKASIKHRYRHQRRSESIA